jgi:hypothetical protein
VGDPVNVYGAIAWAINLGSVIVIGVLGWWFNHRLRRCDPGIYESLGSPSFKPSFKNSSPRQQLRYMQFLFSSEWRRLSDPALVIGYFALRILSCIYLILFLTIVVMFLRGDFRPTKDHPRFGSLDQHNSMKLPKTGRQRGPGRTGTFRRDTSCNIACREQLLCFRGTVAAK